MRFFFDCQSAATETIVQLLESSDGNAEEVESVEGGWRTHRVVFDEYESTSSIQICVCPSAVADCSSTDGFFHWVGTINYGGMSIIII